MKLTEYINQAFGGSQAAFARKARMLPKNVCTYIKGRPPSVKMMIKIYAATDGLVTPNDLIPLPEISKNQ